MNIFLMELKAHRKSLILWCIGIIFLVVSSMAKYAGLSTSGQSMNELLAGMPKSLQAIMGTGTLDLSTAIGYFGILTIYLYLMATVHAAMLGANIISKEERDKTAEFLFVKPVSRSKIISSKLLAALVNIVIINIITWVSSFYMVKIFSEGESVSGDITTIMAAIFILQILFLVIGSAIAAVSKNPKKAGSISTGILLITYILSIVIDLNENIEYMKFLSPFKYFESKNVMFGGGLDPVFVLLSLSMIAVLTMGTFVFYKNRDLNL